MNAAILVALRTSPPILAVQTPTECFFYLFSSSSFLGPDYLSFSSQGKVLPRFSSFCDSYERWNILLQCRIRKKGIQNRWPNSQQVIILANTWLELGDQRMAQKLRIFISFAYIDLSLFTVGFVQLSAKLSKDSNHSATYVLSTWGRKEYGRKEGSRSW